MIMISLQSGSNGNCIYVESGRTRLLLDAGISGRQAQLRLAGRGRDIARVDALIISHDHSDHVRCMGVYQRRFGLPICATRRTLEAAAAAHPLGPLRDVRPFVPGQTLVFESLAVQTVPTPHDGAEGVAFVVDDGRRRLGVLTDLGHVFHGLTDVIRSLDAVLLESNYDPDMLARGPYPPWLQARIRGPRGHLSNIEGADLLRAARGRGMRWACLGHLSEQNNDPQLALDTHRRIIGPGLPLCLAGRYAATGVLEV